jgi:uncharacterized LabA/DUF88 family protein
MNDNYNNSSKLAGKKNYAFIDAQNLHQSSKTWGWKLDYAKFRKFLTQKYNVETAYLFMGYVQQHAETYTNLQKKGYVLIFREALEHNGQVYKANCDTDLVLRVMIDIEEFDKAVIVSGDGDYVPMIHHLINRDKFGSLLVPNKSAYSLLLKKATRDNIDYINVHRNELQDDEYARQLAQIHLKKQEKLRLNNANLEVVGNNFEIEKAESEQSIPDLTITQSSKKEILERVLPHKKPKEIFIDKTALEIISEELINTPEIKTQFVDETKNLLDSFEKLIDKNNNNQIVKKIIRPFVETPIEKNKTTKTLKKPVSKSNVKNSESEKEIKNESLVSSDVKAKKEGKRPKISTKEVTEVQILAN